MGKGLKGSQSILERHIINQLIIIELIITINDMLISLAFLGIYAFNGNQANLAKLKCQGQNRY